MRGGSVNQPNNTNQAQEELAELVKLQSKNEELRMNIEDITKKMLQLRKAAKKGKSVNLSKELIRDILGISADAEEVKPPPEYYQLKKEVRAKQNEVRALRKKWWTDHKDLDSIADKVRQQVQAGGTMAHAFSKGRPNGSKEAPAPGVGGGEAATPPWVQSLAGARHDDSAGTEQTAAYASYASEDLAEKQAPRRASLMALTATAFPGANAGPPTEGHGLGKPVVLNTVAEAERKPTGVPPRKRFSQVQAQLQTQLRRAPGNQGESMSIADLLVSGQANH